jgi:D-3-phosphoglycerate dehydrogenase
MKRLTQCHVLVTPTSFGQEDTELIQRLEEAVGRVSYNRAGKPLSSSLLHDLLPGVDGYIAGLDTVDRSALEAADSLRVIARYGSGIDRVDVEAAREKGIVVTNTPGANTVSVAELAIGLMLTLARQICTASASTKSGAWPRLHGVALQGKVVGVLGFGAIGRQVARRLRAFDCTVVAYDPIPDVEFAELHGVELVQSVDEVVRRADFLTLHVPASPATRGMVDAAFLDKMKQGSYLINTARGELIDEEALLDALKSGKLQGAALDAFATEPPDASNPLLALPNVVATPHTGSHTDGATNAMGWAALDDCLAVLQGEAPKYPVH